MGACRPGLLLLLLLLQLLTCAAAVVAAGEGEPTDLPAAERGLLERHSLSSRALVEQGNLYHRAVSRRRFKGPVLGYVTPWNGHGYDVAVRWRAKFTHVSPVWYQLKPGQDGRGLQLTGGHDVDQGWIARLREPVTPDPGCEEGEGEAAAQVCEADYAALTPPKVVPRVILELPPQTQVEMLQRPGEAIALLVDEVQAQGFDGLVLEAWVQWAAAGGLRDAGFRAAALDFIVKLAANLRQHGKALLLAVPPVNAAAAWRPAADVQHLRELAADLEGFSLMTYDAASGPGPNAPLPWVRENLEALLEPPPAKGKSKGTAVAPGQVLLGLNWYGTDWARPDASPNAQAQPSPIMGPAFLRALKSTKPKLHWEADAAEHRAKYKDAAGTRHTVWYPTPASIAARLELAAERGAGVSIWELGQGLDSFLDLL